MAELFKIAEAKGEKRANAIFFHGLGGDALTTWQADELNKATLWPAWLGQDIEGLSVYCVGYEAPISDCDRATMHPTDLASNVLNGLLVDPRLNDGELILIGHSLGGLVIKLMLRKAQAESNRRAEVARFIDRVRKVAFIATPHSGADLARLANLLRILVRPSEATNSLVRNDAYLVELNEGYRELAKGIVHLILTESRPLIVRKKFRGVTLRKNLGLIVKPDQGDPGVETNPIPIPADHIEIAKPLNRDVDNIYRFVHDFITRHAERPVSREEIKIDTVKEDTQAIRAELQELAARVASEKGVPAAPLLAVLIKLGEKGRGHSQTARCQGGRTDNAAYRERNAPARAAGFGGDSGRGAGAPR